jgi:hypothetical protein
MANRISPFFFIKEQRLPLGKAQIALAKSWQAKRPDVASSFIICTFDTPKVGAHKRRAITVAVADPSKRPGQTP